MTYESVKKWILPGSPPVSLLKKYKIDPVIAGLLLQRGIKPAEEQKFLYPTIDQIPSHKDLFGAKTAAIKIRDHIEKGSKILIHGDFDADGICATTILWEFLYRELSKHLGKKIDVLPYIPDRVEEGYGLSESSIDSLKELGADLVITVDCGIRDKDLIEKYMSQDLDFIVTDHHVPPEDLFSTQLSYTVVHPMHPKKPYPQQEISGATVAFLLTQALRDVYKISRSVNTPGLDLAAFSTITDMMPLTGSNRALVNSGLIKLRSGDRLGLSTLALQAGMKKEDIDTYHIGFILGPRINATGRIGSPLDGVRLLSTQNRKQASELSLKLEQLNSRRKQLTEEILREVQDQIDPSKSIIIAVGTNWPEGIIGLVAGKIMEQHSKPTVVISKNSGGARGSARSLEGFHITNALEKLSDHLVKYGGHSEAAGFNIDPSQIDTLVGKLEEIASDEIGDSILQKELKIELLLNDLSLDLRFIEKLQLTAPWGIGNRKPLQGLMRCVVIDKRMMGKNGDHLKLELKLDTPETLEAIMFNCPEDIAKINVDDLIDIAGYLDINRWNGNVSIQFSIKEWRYSDQALQA